MTSPELERLADKGYIEREPPSPSQIDTLVLSGDQRLRDAEAALSLVSRFDLAYNAAHALALAALRRLGYRSSSRYMVFQCLEHTAALAPAQWRVLALAHQRRNQLEYDGVLNVDHRLIKETIAAARAVLSALRGASAADATKG